MGEYSFAQCYNLGEVAFQAGSQIKTIPTFCFATTALTSITIPASVDDIVIQSFYQCGALNEIIFLNKGQWYLDDYAFFEANIAPRVYGYEDSSTKGYADSHWDIATFHPIDVEIIAELPENSRVLKGDTITLDSLLYTENGTLTYRWYADGEYIRETTVPELQVLPMSATSNKVTYRLETVNSYDPEQSVTQSCEATILERIDRATVASIPDQAFTGKPLYPQPILTHNRLPLIHGIHYTLEYFSNQQVGTGRIVVTGRGDFGGTHEINFKIVTDPTKPVDPTDPTDPIDPTDPDPTDPVTPIDPDPVKPIVFTDVPKNSSEWYVPWIYSATERGLASGYTDGRGNLTGYFGPHDRITRGQVATIMYRASVEDATATTDVAKYAANQTSFTDVPDNLYYTAAINWAKENGILLGNDGTTLARPEDNISRQELATMMHRLAQHQNLSSTTIGMAQNPAITDWNLVANWAYDHILWTSNMGVMGGFDNHDGTFTLRPFDTASRAEMAKMIVALTDLEDVE